MNPLLRAVLGLFAAPRVNMREDYAKVRQLQRQLAALPRPGYRSASWRTVVAGESSADSGAGESEDSGAGESGEAPPVRVRVFVPHEKRREDLLLFFHGGGWVTGDIESYTPACATMADLTGAEVVSVDYRLAPEHPFPAGLEDCFRIVHRLLEDPSPAGLTDPDRIVLVGDSAGANLVAVVSLMLHEQGMRGASRQILLYPVTHWDHDPRTSPFASVRRHGAGLRLTSTEVEDYMQMYVPDPKDRQDPRVAPLMARDFSGQPRTLVISAELDLLCDEGEAYARALADAGVDARLHRVEGALHGFITLPRFSRSLRDAYVQINAFLDEEPPEAGSHRPHGAQGSREGAD